MRKCVVFSGAGLSAESGLDTFRDNNGLWAQYDPMQVCNYENWLDNFSLVHRFYNLRREELANVEPNACHIFLANLPSILNESLSKAQTTNDKQFEDVEVIHITQNVDNLLERAGAKNVIHLHGELTKITCPRCEIVFDIGYSSFDFEESNCQNCGYSHLKPFVVFFYEKAPQYETMYKIFSQLTSKDCLLVIGTSGNVVDIGSLITYTEYKHKIGLKILNNLSPSPHISESIFDKVFYTQATNAIQLVQEALLDFYKPAKF